MKILSPAELLTIWEEGMEQPLLEKSIRLLSKAFEEDVKTMGHLSIGQRDARLLHLHEWMFGSTLRNLANCPQCNETIEWETNTRDLTLQPILPDGQVKTFTCEKEGYRIRFRLPDSYDISRAVVDPSYLADQKKLIADCILEKTKEGITCEGNTLPDEIWNAVEEQMAKEDPQADIRMTIICPSCSYRWDAGFDIAGFLWAEIQNWAQRIMQEVYLLARSFGWSEKDILNMGARRRQTYLQMLPA